MKCKEVNELLVAYSDGEVTPSERTLVRGHLAGCELCEKRLAALSATQGRVRRSLQVRAARVAPSPQAWDRLHARLAEEARPASWLWRLRSGVGRISQGLAGGLTLRKGLALVTLAILSVAVCAIIFVPPVRAQVIDTIRHVALGAHTWAMQVVLQSKGESKPLPPDMWIIRTDIGNFGGNAPPGVDPTVRSLASFEEAQAITGFHLRAPVDLPEGYALGEIKLAPMGGTQALLFYAGPGHDIIVVQMPGGPRPSDEPNVLVSVGIGLLTDGPLEEIDFDGRPAVWTEDHSLMWEADGITYVVGGLDLDLEQTLQIARSLH